MQEPLPARESALRGVWTALLVIGVLFWVGIHPEQFGDDVVSDAFRRFFTIFGIVPGFVAVVILFFVVVRRVEQGDPIKEDLSLILSALSVILTIIWLLFPNVVTTDFKGAGSWILSIFKPLS
jgi:cytochrome bd-type quinol oxidase subunit 2